MNLHLRPPHRLLLTICLLPLLCHYCRAQSPTDTYFPILNWDLPLWSEAPFAHPTHGLASLAQCGFNTAAFVRPQHLPAVQKLGLHCILAPKDFPTPWRTLSDAQITATVQKMVDEAANNPTVVGFFLADEPGQPDFAALAKAVAAVKKLAPGKLAYINLFPDYATLGAPDISQLGTATYADYLEQFVTTVHPQFISYDNYQIQYSQDQHEPAGHADYYTNLCAVRQIAFKHHLPFWNIVASNQIQPQFPPPSPANLLLQAYTTLAAGAKGLTWYTYYGSTYPYAPIDKNGGRTPTWSYLQMVNDQVQTLAPTLLPLESTGLYFTPPLPSPNLPTLPSQLLPKLTATCPLMVGEFTHPATHQKYVMIVNLSLTDSAQITLPNAATLQQISPTDASLLPLDPTTPLRLPAGQGALLKLP